MLLRLDYGRLKALQRWKRASHGTVFNRTCLERCLLGADNVLQVALFSTKAEGFEYPALVKVAVAQPLAGLMRKPAY
jgi:hypothetical protein